MALKHSQAFRTIPFLIAVCLLAFSAQAKYGGGSGTADDPYQIATAADLILLGESPDDYGKHFILTADIDLDPSLPGRKVFDKAVIAPDANDVAGWFQGNAFGGVFDGGGHTISHLTITGGGYSGVFGQLASGTEVQDLGVVDVNVIGSASGSEGHPGGRVGALVGSNRGAVMQCYATGVIGRRGFSKGRTIRACGGKPHLRISEVRISKLETSANKQSPNVLNGTSACHSVSAIGLSSFGFVSSLGPRAYTFLSYLPASLSMC